MRIAVAGAICFDESIDPGGQRRTGYGGVLYNVAAFSGLLRPPESVLPVSNLGEDHCGEVLKLIESWRGVDPFGIAPIPFPTTHVTLRWRNQSDRDEVVRHLMPPIELDALRQVAGADALHINFTTGGDVALETLAEFRRTFNGLVSMDVHQRIAAFDRHGRRALTGFHDWPEWVRHVDVVQCNEQELAAMFRHPPGDDTGLARAAAAICDAGPKAVCVTLAHRGALMVHRHGMGRYVVRLEAPRVMPVVDTTGCGDSFSAGFLVGLLQHDDAVSAMALGLLTAAVNAGYKGLRPLTPAAAYRDTPRAHLPELASHPPHWQGDLLPGHQSR